MDTDSGRGYLKAMGGPEGPHTLAAEVVATQLAAWFKLPVFDWAIVRVDEFTEIPFFNPSGEFERNAEQGPAYITQEESGAPWNGGERQLKMLMNPEAISRLVVFDTWVLNCDRYSERLDSVVPQTRINRDNVFLSGEAPKGEYLLKAMDHTHCFSCGREWTTKLSHLDRIRVQRSFGLFPEFRKYLRIDAVADAAADLKLIHEPTVREFVSVIPVEWEVSRQVADALIDLIVRRAGYVADNAKRIIWPQGQLFDEDL
ncbi:hypothetical protein M4951_25120 [Blastopirellula sp. J2-11]|uniref:HipA family kinase n=1 Tax=Blastopirellula sp. J2-11 TaxID=2943192 RepID=UPI0021C6DD8A|nr:HipA family kinase [Blastopirellula sp. J2-11]UUO06612.1 hypothetical protein M4951_25120 [Blastopirellula sp. J2-11]